MMNYFELFNLPTRLPIDKKQLSDAYQNLQKQHHPDKLALASEGEKLVSIQQSAEINLAYKTLKDPIESIAYLLILQGHDEQDETLNDVDFLEKQFELRESLEQLEETKDWTGLSQFEQTIVSEFKQVEQHTITLLNQQEWSQAAAKLNELRYLQKLKIHIEELQESQFAL